MIVLNLIDASELSERSESRHAIATKLNFFFWWRTADILILCTLIQKWRIEESLCCIIHPKTRGLSNQNQSFMDMYVHSPFWKLVKNKACFSLFIVVNSHQGQSTAAISRHDSGTSNIISPWKWLRVIFFCGNTYRKKIIMKIKPTHWLSGETFIIDDMNFNVYAAHNSVRNQWDVSYGISLISSCVHRLRYSCRYETL